MTYLALAARLRRRRRVPVAGRSPRSLRRPDRRWWAATGLTAARAGGAHRRLRQPDDRRRPVPATTRPAPAGRARRPRADRGLRLAAGRGRRAAVAARCCSAGPARCDRPRSDRAGTGAVSRLRPGPRPRRARCRWVNTAYPVRRGVPARRRAALRRRGAASGLGVAVLPGALQPADVRRQRRLRLRVRPAQPAQGRGRGRRARPRRAPARRSGRRCCRNVPFVVALVAARRRSRRRWCWRSASSRWSPTPRRGCGSRSGRSWTRSPRARTSSARPCFGLALAGRGATRSTRTALAALAGFFLWGVGSHAFGAVQDVDGRPGRRHRLDRHRAGRPQHHLVRARGATSWPGLLLLALPWPGTLVARCWCCRTSPTSRRTCRLTDEECEQANAGLAPVPVAQLPHRLPGHAAADLDQLGW